MTNSDKISVILLGAAAGVALVKFFNMDEEEREKFFNHLKDRLQYLLKDTEGTVDTVKKHFAMIDDKPSGAWIDKMMIFKKLLTSLFGTEGNAGLLARG